ncbi:MAG TPA: T9SS type A sorting domain-containing protein [Bacteroidia bacterium]|nr:T9SS type A sorting domain-containing protein [Bacteroidia bacterium]
MKRSILITLSSIFRFSFCLAQWDSVQHGVISNNEGNSGNGIYALANYKGALYVGGIFDSAGNQLANNIATWDGVNWNIVSNVNGEINAFATYNGDLIVGGSFDSAGGVPYSNIAQWNGTAWSSLGLGISKGSINEMTVYNGNLYVAGYFDSAGGQPTKNIAMWNGSVWSPVGSINGEAYAAVYSLSVYKGNLYAGGYFDSAGGVQAKNIAMWNGSTWASLGSGIKDSFICAFTVFNGELYAGGLLTFHKGGQMGILYKWNGTLWSLVGTGVTGVSKLIPNSVYALYVYDSAVCVGGSFDSIGGIKANDVAFWNGTNWGTFGSGMGIYGTPVSSFCSYNSVLYAGGLFDSAGGVQANNIAQWGGPLAMNSVEDNRGDVNVFPNPSDGRFTIRSSVNSRQSLLEIYSVLGEKIYQESLRRAQGDCMIDLSNQPGGVYFYRIIAENSNVLGSGKLIIQK